MIRNPVVGLRLQFCDCIAADEVAGNWSHACKLTTWTATIPLATYEAANPMALCFSDPEAGTNANVPETALGTADVPHLFERSQRARTSRLFMNS
jgi:hypothetical protein